MLLAIDIGNSRIHGGVFSDDILKFKFRKTSQTNASDDEMGLFLRQILRENCTDPSHIKEVSICSVVPDCTQVVMDACKKYFFLEPFLLNAHANTGLDIRYKNPAELGSDRIANAVAARKLHPQKNIIVLDFGTATTFCAVSSSNKFLGGAIIPGMRTAMNSLFAKTSKLPKVDICIPEFALGKTPIENIQSGLFFGCVGAVRELTQRLSVEAFQGEKPFIVATGGFAGLFAKTGIYDAEVPDLTLIGVAHAFRIATKSALNPLL